MVVLKDILRPTNDLTMALLNMQMSDRMCDITLVANDYSKIKAHKLVLVAMSPYLQRMLSNGNSFDTFIFKRARIETVTSLIQFLYGNYYAINVQNARDIYPFASQLELSHVSELCEYLDPSVTKASFGGKCIMPLATDSIEQTVESSQNPVLPDMQLSKAKVDKNQNVRGKKRTQSGTICEASVTVKPKKANTLANQTQKASMKNKKLVEHEAEDSKDDIRELIGRELLTEQVIGTVNSADRLYECAICRMVYPSIKEVESHMLADHGCKETETVDRDDNESNEGDCEDNSDDNEHGEVMITMPPPKLHGFKFSSPIVSIKYKADSEKGFRKQDSTARERRPSDNQKLVVKLPLSSSPRRRAFVEKEPEDRELEVDDPLLPRNWRKIIRKRKGSDRFDCQIISPDGRRFKSRKQIALYLERNRQNIDMTKFNFSTQTAKVKK